MGFNQEIVVQEISIVIINLLIGQLTIIQKGIQAVLA